MSDERDVRIEIRRKDAQVDELRVSSGDRATPWETPAPAKRAIAAARSLRLRPGSERRQVRAARQGLELLCSVPFAHEKLQSLVPTHDDDCLDAPRLIVEVAGHDADAELLRTDASRTAEVVHQLLFELIAIDKPNGLDQVGVVMPLCCDLWPLLRHVPLPKSAAERPERPVEPRLLLVIGSQVQPRNSEDVRADSCALIERLCAIDALGDFVIAIPKQELAQLRARVRRDGLAASAELLGSRSRCVELRQVEDLLALVRGDEHRTPFDVIVWAGHSFESDEGQSSERVEATALDLGLPRGDALPPGPGFEELARALGHERTRVLALYACNVGPKAPLALLGAVEHCVVTAARVRPLWAHRSIEALLEQLFRHRTPMEEAVRVARCPSSEYLPITRWWLQHWASTLERRPLLDPVRIGLREFRDRARAQAKLDLEGTLLANRVADSDSFVRLTIEEHLDRTWDGDQGAKEQYSAGELEWSWRPHARWPDRSQRAQLVDLLAEYREGNARLRRLVVLAGPGAGKTVMMLRTRQLLAESGDWIPVFVRLRRWTEDRDVLELVVSPATDREGRQRAALADARRRGRMVFLLDGLDEVPTEHRAPLVERIHALAAERGSIVVVTSRPIGYQVLDGFTQIGLHALDDEDRREFVELRLGVSHEKIEEVQEGIARRCEQSPSFERLAGNPLFLTLVADLLAHGKRVGAKPHELLKEILDYLLDQLHRQFLDREPFRDVQLIARVLSDLAVQLTMKLRAEIDEEVLRLWAAIDVARRHQTALQSSGDWQPSWRWKDWLEDLARRSGVFSRVHDDTGQVSWQFRHRALQEFLTARHLAELHARDGEDAVLHVAEQAAADDDQRAERVNYWAEPFALLAGMLTQGQPDAWILRLVENAGTRPIALRAALNARELRDQTVIDLLAKLDSWRDRVQVYEALLEERNAARAATLLRRAARTEESGDALWHADAVLAQLDHEYGAIPEEQRTELVAHLPPPKAGVLARVPGHRGEFAWKSIPAGGFEMGSPVKEPGHRDDETQVPVDITRQFWALATPLTVAMFKVFEPSFSFRASDESAHPATRVTWFQAAMFCRWLTLHGQELLASWSRLDAGLCEVPADFVFRLPSEAEWERLCRGGTDTAFWCGAELTAEVACFGAREGGVKPVASKMANPFGLYDVHGNCWEWCRDWYSPRLVGGRDPVGPRRGSDRVLRGGSVWYEADLCRSAFRVWLDPALRFDGVGGFSGFRPVLAPPLPSSGSVFDDR